MDSNKYRIKKCSPESNYCVWIEFEDGFAGRIDLSDLLDKPAFLAVWTPYEGFNRLWIDPETHTLTWGEPGNEVDVNPRSLREEIELEGNADAKDR